MEPKISFADWLLDRIKASLTAILCLGDEYAVEAIRILVKHGLSVPQHLAVIGYDNTYISRIYNPSITSVNVPVKEMIETAAKVLFELMDNKELKEMSFEFKNELIIRESCGGGNIPFQKEEK